MLDFFVGICENGPRIGGFMAKIATVQSKNGLTRQGSQSAAIHRVEVEKVAYQLFLDRGCEHGHQDEDWAKAEAIVRNRQNR